MERPAHGPVPDDRPLRRSVRRLLPLGARLRGIRRELRTLLLFAALAAGTWVFVELAGLVLEGEARAADEALLLALRERGDPSNPIGPPWLEELGRDVTALGSIGVLALLVGGSAGFLALDRKPMAAALLVAAVGSGVAVSSVLKAGFDRPRPDLVPHGHVVFTRSFPSGHSMHAAVAYLTLGALLARVQCRRRLKVYVLLLPAAVTVLVGASRVYLGVHWPTDVLAGWMAGAVWAILWWLAALALQRRGKVEGEAGAGPEAAAGP